jgi:hypothetical protein
LSAVAKNACSFFLSALVFELQITHTFVSASRFFSFNREANDSETCFERFKSLARSLLHFCYIQLALNKSDSNFFSRNKARIKTSTTKRPILSQQPNTKQRGYSPNNHRARFVKIVEVLMANSQI